MLAVEAAAKRLPSEQVHFEWFTAKEPAASAINATFTVKLARSGRCFEVPPDKTILAVLEENGVTSI